MIGECKHCELAVPSDIYPNYVNCPARKHSSRCESPVCKSFELSEEAKELMQGIIKALQESMVE